MSEAPAPVTVLLVDDQPIVAEAVRRMLATDDTVTFVYEQDPALAIATALQSRPTVILQDLVMPGVDGLDMVTRYREHPATKDVPLIVLSSVEDPDVKVVAFTRGANDYLVKLPDPRELIARVRYHSAAYTRLLERNAAYRDLERRNRFIRDVFGRYVSDEIVEDLLASPAGLRLRGERRMVTVMMADLRGFTSMSERGTPEEVVAVLNRFLGAMTDVIVEHGGTIDEILGDALLVIFGAPVKHEDHARRAVRCAVAMQLALDVVNDHLRADALPPVTMGIGLHTGEVVAGNIGSSRRAKYGVVGATVNLAARIESFTIGGQILISDTTRAAAGDDLRIDGTLEVSPKGVPAAITVSEIGGIGELALRRGDFTMVPLDPPIDAHYTMLEGKHLAEGQFTGRVTHASELELEVACDRPPRAFTDVRVDLEDAPAPVYAKVMPRPPGLPPGFRARLTAVPPDVADQLRSRRLHGDRA